jgi:hypothetical protein
MRNQLPFDAEPGADFAARFQKLANGRLGLRGGLITEVRETPNAGSRATVDFISSTQRLDRYEEIICADGWQLEEYRRNPVFQNAHQYGDVLFTLGKALITEVRDGCLFQRIEFAVEANPVARIAYNLYRGRFLNAVSVGFLPVRWEIGGPGAGYRRKHLEQELIEVSAVSIPANPEALQLGLRAGAVVRADLEEWLEVLHAAGLARPNLANPPAPRSAGADWLQLAGTLERWLAS